MSTLGYLFKVIGGLPVWIKVLLYLLFGTIVVAIAGYFGLFAALVAAAIVIIVGILLITFSLLAQWARDRRAAELRGELDRQHFADPSAQSRLADLQASFDAGLGKFDVTGRSRLELPWFLLIGEPGAGKTEAIRQSRIELPDTLQDPEQGRGGTSCLDWWFTNFAVILDTSGHLVFGSPDRATTSDWQELANLLRQSRRGCPLNGVIIAIPADSLIRDSDREIERKAGIIARHLDTLRYRLKVSIPAFVIITKSDQIPGFSDFFADLEGKDGEQQIFGWSNPAPLEAPFRPDIVDEYSLVMAQRLRRRRLATLMDPLPLRPNERRADEVDTLFDFPGQIEKLRPRLTRYVDGIFRTGGWTSKPLPLRGTYFTSAQAASPQAPTAPESAPGPTTSSRFLRDVFLDKIFREDGLVVNIARGDNGKYLLWFLIATLILVALFFAALNGYNRLVANQAAQLGLWDRATIGWKDRSWMPIVERRAGFGHTFVYRGMDPVGTGLSVSPDRVNFPQQNLSLFDYHLTLANVGSTPLGIPLVFAPYILLGTNPDRDRLKAQKVIFNASVVQPILDAARTRMATVQTDATTDPARDANLTADFLADDARALTELVRVETAIVARQQGKHNALPGADFVPTLLSYATNADPAAAQIARQETALANLMNWTYSTNPYGRGTWAPAWASGGNSLAKNQAISAGIDRLIAYAHGRVADLENNLRSLANFAADVEKYSLAEDQLAKAASVRDDFSAAESAVGNAVEALDAAKIQLEQELQAIRVLGLFEDGPETLSDALVNLSSGKHSHLGQVNVILSLIDSVLPADDKPAEKKSEGLHILIEVDAPDYTLLREIRDRLTGIADIIKKNVDAKIDEKLVATYRDLDRAVLEPYQGLPGYLWRWNAYHECIAAAPASQFRPDMYLVDQRFSQLQNLLGSLNEIQGEIDTYTGPEAANFLTICNYFLRRMKYVQTNLFIFNYVQQAREALLRVARFPLVYPPGPENEALDVYQLTGAKTLLDAISADLQTQTFQDIPLPQSKVAVGFAKRIAPLYNVINALLKPDGSTSRVTITLYNGQAQRQLSGPNFAPMPTPGPSPTPAPRSLMSKVFGLGGNPAPDPEIGQTINVQDWNAIELVTQGASGIFPLSAQSDVLLGTFPIESPFSFRVYHTLSGDGGSDLIDGGQNWSALRLIARLGAKPLGVGQDWQVALKPNEPNSVWVKFSFQLPLLTTPWPTIDSLGLRNPIPEVGDLTPADQSSASANPIPSADAPVQ